MLHVILYMLSMLDLDLVLFGFITHLRFCMRCQMQFVFLYIPFMLLTDTGVRAKSFVRACMRLSRE